jgi:predicted transcriptional regulator
MKQETKQEISDNVKSILTAATHSSDINAIAAELGVSVQVVTGSIGKLKKAELATYVDRKLVLTKSGLAAINVTTKKVKNKELVATIVNSNTGLEHGALVELIAQTLGKTKIDARVYLYNYQKAAGLRTVGQKQEVAAA